MSTFRSTRGATADLGTALLSGLAPDGGLYMPDPMAELAAATAPAHASASFADLAEQTLTELLSAEVSADVVAEVSRAAFNFPVPLVEVEEGVHVLELFHGPTHAFKDFGARFMARLMAALDSVRDGGGAPRTVLVATSGDTGGAVANAFRGLPGYRTVVLFPAGGISGRQRRQMTTLGEGVVAIGVQGTFDDCQRMAKEAFADRGLSEAHRLTSANSINVGRLLPQMLYYLFAAGRLAEPARFVVPCGNLGNLCAGLMAHAVGMPANGFVAATNANDVFPAFLASGRYEPRDSVVTISNAMDVGRPSNLERIRWMFRDDPDRLGRLVRGASVDDEATTACIREVFERTGHVLDPHTAVAYRAHAALADGAETPTVILATAHPAKFPETVEAAIGAEVRTPPGISAVLEGEESFVEIGPTLPDLMRVLNGDTRP